MDRNWDEVGNLWRSLLQAEPQAPFVVGDSQYGLSCLKDIHESYLRGEATSSDFRYTKRRTMAFRLGYDGTKYFGYQTQKDKELRTIEDAVFKALGGRAQGAGRTDRGVSALGQILCVTKHKEKEDMTPEEVVDLIKASPDYKGGDLGVYECYQVPRKFNSRSSATWRRYLYVIPLKRSEDSNVLNGNSCSTHPFDLDCNVMNAILQKIEGRLLGYNNFSKGDNLKGQGDLDKCIVYRARAFPIDLHNPHADYSGIDRTSESAASTNESGDGDTSSQDRDEIDMNTALEYACPALCVEIVGNRFLHNMVRKLVATTCRECVMPVSERNENILVDVCEQGDKLDSAPPFPGDGLCLAGVGFDKKELAHFKYASKVKTAQIEEENARMAG
jgi:tRNA pseudouridine(38-40) synthase